jgi:hypothetical protein
MAKEFFFHAESAKLFKKLEELTRRSGVSRGQAFEDWLTAMVCALAAETKEGEYLAMVEKHKEGKRGQRGIDLISEMFADLVVAMSSNDGDVLGDLFQGCISYGENGQYLTPETLATFMARLCLDENVRPTSDEPMYVNDPCCGTGRLLLEAAKLNPHVELVGQDIDPRCAKISAINLGLRSRYGWIICGNTLTNETYFAYRIGSFFNETQSGLRRGMIREVLIGETPVELATRQVREAASKVIGEQGSGDGSVAIERSSIIEVPRWLARLEPGLTGLERVDHHVVETSVGETVISEMGEPARKQRTLFDGD